LRLRFDRHAYCAIELKKGEAAKSIAKKFRELVLELERLEKGKGQTLLLLRPAQIRPRPACGPPAALAARQ
jgi:hypothetical protein